MPNRVFLNRNTVCHRGKFMEYWNRIYVLSEPSSRMASPFSVWSSLQDEVLESDQRFILGITTFCNRMRRTEVNDALELDAIGRNTRFHGKHQESELQVLPVGFHRNYWAQGRFPGSRVTTRFSTIQVARDGRSLSMPRWVSRWNSNQLIGFNPISFLVEYNLDQKSSHTPDTNMY